MVAVAGGLCRVAGGWLGEVELSTGQAGGQAGLFAERDVVNRDPNPCR